MPSSPQEAMAWQDVLNQISVVVLLVVVVLAFVREWVVVGSAHRRQLQEAAERERQWRELALGGTAMAGRLVDVARRASGEADGPA